VVDAAHRCERLKWVRQRLATVCTRSRHWHRLEDRRLLAARDPTALSRGSLFLVQASTSAENRWSAHIGSSRPVPSGGAGLDGKHVEPFVPVRSRFKGIPSFSGQSMMVALRRPGHRPRRPAMARAARHGIK
jgi:hypothetical protein